MCPARDVSRWETDVPDLHQERKPELRAALEREKKMTAKIEADLTAAIAEFKAKYFRRP